MVSLTFYFGDLLFKKTKFAPNSSSHPFETMAVTHISTDIQREKNSQLLTITLPDLFKSFLAQAPSLNPHYEAVGKESEQWLSKLVCPYQIPSTLPSY